MKPHKPLLLLLLLTSIQFFGIAQQVTDVVTEQVGKQVRVHYTLIGEGSYDVYLFLKKEGDSRWQGPLNAVSGDVGPSQQAGYNKTITWNVLAERDKVVGDWVFGIKAEDPAKKGRGKVIIGKTLRFIGKVVVWSVVIFLVLLGI